MPEFHPLAELFPMMTADEIRALAVDVKEHGLLEPVVLTKARFSTARYWLYGVFARLRRN